MLKELQEIAEEHENLNQFKNNSLTSIKQNNKENKDNKKEIISSSFSTNNSLKIIAVLEVEVKGKKLKLKIPENCKPEEIINEFIQNNKLSSKSFQPLLIKVQKMIEEYEKQQENNNSNDNSFNNSNNSSFNNSTTNKSNNNNNNNNNNLKNEILPKNKEPSLLTLLSSMENSNINVNVNKAHVSQNVQTFLDNILSKSHSKEKEDEKEKDLNFQTNQNLHSLPLSHNNSSNSFNTFNSSNNNNNYSSNNNSNNNSSYSKREHLNDDNSTTTSLSHITIKVKISPNNTVPLIVTQDSDATSLAKTFVQMNNLPQTSYIPILIKVQSAIEKLKIKRNESKQSQDDSNNNNSYGSNSNSNSNNSNNLKSQISNSPTKRSASAPALTPAERLRQTLKNRREGRETFAKIVQEVGLNKSEPNVFNNAFLPQTSTQLQQQQQQQQQYPRSQSASPSSSVSDSHSIHSNNVSVRQGSITSKQNLYQQNNIYNDKNNNNNNNNNNNDNSNQSDGSVSSQSLSPLKSLSAVYQTINKKDSTDFSLASDKTPGGTTSIRVRLPGNKQAVMRVNVETEPSTLARQFMDSHHLPISAFGPLVSKIRVAQEGMLQSLKKDVMSPIDEKEQDYEHKHGYGYGYEYENKDDNNNNNKDKDEYQKEKLQNYVQKFNSQAPQTPPRHLSPAERLKLALKNRRDEREKVENLNNNNNRQESISEPPSLNSTPVRSNYKSDSSYVSNSPSLQSSYNNNINNNKELNSKTTSSGFKESELSNALQRLSNIDPLPNKSSEPSIDSKSSISRHSNASNRLSVNNINNDINNNNNNSNINSTNQIEKQDNLEPRILSPNSIREQRFQQSLIKFKEMHFSSNQTNMNFENNSNHSSSNLSNYREPVNLGAMVEESVVEPEKKLSLDVRVNETTVEKIEFRLGESPYGIAAIFTAMHKLPSTYIKPLALEIQNMMTNHIKKLPPPPPPPPSSTIPEQTITNIPVTESPSSEIPQETIIPTTTSTPTSNNNNNNNINDGENISEIASTLNTNTPENQYNIISNEIESQVIESQNPPPFRRSLAESILSPPRHYVRPKSASSSISQSLSLSQSDDRSINSNQSSRRSISSKRESNQRKNNNKNIKNYKNDNWRNSDNVSNDDNYNDNIMNQTNNFETSGMKKRDSLSVSSRSPNRRSRSVSPQSQSSSIHERLFRDAEINALRLQKFRSDLERAEQKERETQLRKKRSRSFSGQRTLYGKDQRDTYSNTLNGDDAIYYRNLKWREKQEHARNEVRKILLEQAKNLEDKECTFHPKLEAVFHGKLRPHESELQKQSDGNSNIFDILYQNRRERQEKKEKLINQNNEEIKQSSFHPTIDSKSKKLAEKKRKKRFYGITAIQQQEQEQQQQEGEGKEDEKEENLMKNHQQEEILVPSEPTTASTKIEPSTEGKSEIDIDDGFHSVREGYEDLISRRSSIESNQSIEQNVTNSPIIAINLFHDELPQTNENNNNNDNNDNNNKDNQNRIEEVKISSIQEPRLFNTSDIPIPTIPLLSTQSQHNSNNQSPNSTTKSQHSIKNNNNNENKKHQQLTLFDTLYEERKLFEKSKIEATQKHLYQPTFQPDIGIAHHRIVEKNVDEFSQRLYDHHQKQQNHLEELVTMDRIRTGEAHTSRNKRIQSDEIERLNQRMQENAKLYREKHENRIKQKEQEIIENGKKKFQNPKTNNYVLKNRRIALEEIFHILLLTVEYSNEMNKNSNEKQTNDSQNWKILKSEGEEVYELYLHEKSDNQSIVYSNQSQQTNEETLNKEDPVSKNLLSMFSQSDIREGTKESSTSPSLKSASSLSSDQSNHQSEIMSNLYYFRGERLAKAEKNHVNPNNLQNQENLKNNEINSNKLELELPQSQLQLQPQVNSENIKQEKLLDTSRAIPNLLKPSSLCQAVTMVLEATTPSLITLNEFIDCFEVLLESGLAPPLNMVLGVPQTQFYNPSKLSSIEKEYLEECRQVPQLIQGKKGTKLREKSKNDNIGISRHEHLYNYDLKIAQKKQYQRDQMLLEASKELTFQPVIYTKRK